MRQCMLLETPCELTLLCRGRLLSRAVGDCLQQEMLGMNGGSGKPFKPWGSTNGLVSCTCGHHECTCACQGCCPEMIRKKGAPHNCTQQHEGELCPLQASHPHSTANSEGHPGAWTTHPSAASSGHGGMMVNMAGGLPAKHSRTHSGHDIALAQSGPGSYRSSGSPLGSHNSYGGTGGTPPLPGRAGSDRGTGASGGTGTLTPTPFRAKPVLWKQLSMHACMHACDSHFLLPGA